MEQHYVGGCQCGAVAYEVDVDVDGCMTCNCSRCQPLGAILAFAPRSQFKLLKGEDNLTEYRFNKRSIAHLFCKTCGIQSFAYGAMPDGSEIAAINLNTLHGLIQIGPDLFNQGFGRPDAFGLRKARPLVLDPDMAGKPGILHFLKQCPVG